MHKTKLSFDNIPLSFFVRLHKFYTKERKGLTNLCICAIMKME